MLQRCTVVDNFKGFHDSVGKDPAHLVKKLELRSPPVRSKNALAVFENCRKYLEKTPADTKWEEYEASGDARLKGKGTFGMDSRTVWFAVETQEDYDELSPKYPGRILFCNRSFILDTHKEKHLPQTKQLHEVRSHNTSIPTSNPKVWQVEASNLPCCCKHCTIDPMNKSCVYTPWRRPRLLKMQIACPLPVEAESWVGKCVSRVVEGNIYSGTIQRYDATKKEWHVKFDDGDVDSFNYVEICAASQLFDDNI